MTVNPGFGGQQLIAETIPKITDIRKQYPKLDLCVDGGVKLDNIADLARSGANEFVAGSAIFKSSNYKKTIDNMRKQLSELMT